MRDVLRSPFVLVQTVFTAATAFGASFGIYALLLRDGSVYALESPMVLISVLMAPLLTTYMAPALTPLALPEAVERGWLGFVESEALPIWLACNPIWRANLGCVRLTLLGIMVGACLVPLALCVLSFAMVPPFAAIELTVFVALYYLLISLLVMPMAILSYCMRPNLELALALMSNHPSRIRRLLLRLCALPRC